MKPELAAFAVIAFAAQVHAQAPAQPPLLGTVSSEEASVSGLLAHQQTASDLIELSGSSNITAKPGRNASVQLTRGGSIRVCQSTTVHLTPSASNSLLLALNRGAIEIRRKAQTSDVLVTPDIRFTFASPGPLDLRIHVTSAGDTCVENRGRRAPQLNVVDAFGDAAYLIKPGQHVTFERGNLHTVLGRETTPCGCPPATPAPLSLAQARRKGTKPQAAANPFPEAVSAGLAADHPGEPEKTGERHVQVASSLTYDAASDPRSQATPPASATPPAKAKGFFASIGHFFKRIFVH